MLGKVRNLSRVSGITTRQPRSAGQPGPIQRAPDATRLPLPIHWHASRGGPRGWRASIALSPTRSPSDDDDDGPSKPCPFPRGMRSTHAPSRPGQPAPAIQSIAPRRFCAPNALRPSTPSRQAAKGGAREEERGHASPLASLWCCCRFAPWACCTTIRCPSATLRATARHTATNGCTRFLCCVSVRGNQYRRGGAAHNW